MRRQEREAPRSPGPRSGARLRRRRWLGLRLLAARRLARPLLDADVVPVLLEDLVADALHLEQVLGRLERAVLLPVLDDGLRLRRTDAVKFLRECPGIGRVDVDRPRPGPHGHEQSDQGTYDESRSLHGCLLGWRAAARYGCDHTTTLAATRSRVPPRISRMRRDWNPAPSRFAGLLAGAGTRRARQELERGYRPQRVPCMAALAAPQKSRAVEPALAAPVTRVTQHDVTHRTGQSPELLDGRRRARRKEGAGEILEIAVDLQPLAHTIDDCRSIELPAQDGRIGDLGAARGTAPDEVVDHGGEHALVARLACHVGQPRQDHRQQVKVALHDTGIEPQRERSVALEPGEVAPQDGAAPELALLAVRAAQVRVRRRQVALRERRFGQLAVIVGDGARLLGQPDGPQSLVRLGSLLPVALDLVDAHQVRQCHRGLAAALRELLEQFLGPVVEPRAKIIACQLGQRGVAVPRIEPVARDDVLVHADRALDFAAAPVKAPQREMRVDGLVIERGQTVKYLQRPVRLFIEQITQALEVALPPTYPATPAPLLVPDRRGPAGRQGARERQPENGAVVSHLPRTDQQGPAHPPGVATRRAGGPGADDRARPAGGRSSSSAMPPRRATLRRTRSGAPGPPTRPHAPRRRRRRSAADSRP